MARTMDTAMTTKEAAAYLKVSYSYISKLVKDGRLPKFYVTHSRPVYYKEDLDAVAYPVSEAKTCDTTVCGGCK